MRDLTKWDGDNVVREAEIRANGLHLMADRVWNPKLNKYGPIQFQMTHDGDITALMEEGAAKLFCLFVKETLERQEHNKDHSHDHT
jgi:hypothetical protein